MLKPLPFTDSLLRALSALVPDLRVQIATSTLLRGETAKGRYDIRLSDDGRELRTSFVAKGRNPLKQSKLLLRAPLGDAEAIQAHAVVIRENEHSLPWIHRAHDPKLGDEIVTVKPFGDDANGPVVAVRTSALTGFVSLEVQNAREMSPAEARLVAKALAKAAKFAAASRAEPVALSEAA
ncbi:MAG: hypothetical protein PHC88_01860 [Terrimicrobiaceae bacterium]|nr:hypothetical protein [Terrimicrobiaceae bacterium]